MKREFLTGLMEMPQEVVDAILAEHEQAVKALQVEYAVAHAITDHGGRNHKAIAALLDTDALAAAEDPRQAAREAVAAVKQDCGYLFESPVPPAYAVATGAAGTAPAPVSDTLAGALRERFSARK